MADKPGVVRIPWYATVFRGDSFAAAVAEIAPVALRYGASDYRVTRSRDDKYRFVQESRFHSKLDWQRYWDGEEMIAFRTRYAGWFQIPVLYEWYDVVVEGALAEAELRS